MRRIFIKLLAVGLLLAIASSCKKEPVQGIIIDDSLLIDVGKTVTLTVTFIPADAANKKVTWESKDTDVATVDHTGNVTGKSVGKTIIKVISGDNGRIAQCIVYVIQPIEPEEMIWVEGGTFTMGPNEGEFYLDDQLPRHEVTLSGFYISKYLVTQKEWSAAMGSRSYPDFALGDDKPAWALTWNDTQEYISKINAHTGKNYRLPTEAEWEYAARGGNKSQGYVYSGSNNIDEVGWYSLNHDSELLHPIGQKKPNELGIYDMSGNAWEWCSDWYGSYTDAHQTNPPGPTGIYRIIRGGSFDCSAFHSRNATRGHISPDTSVGGFRLVLPAE